MVPLLGIAPRFTVFQTVVSTSFTKAALRVLRRQGFAPSRVIHTAGYEPAHHAIGILRITMIFGGQLG